MCVKRSRRNSEVVYATHGRVMKKRIMMGGRFRTLDWVQNIP